MQDGKTSGYFLTSAAGGYFRFISGYVLTSDVGSWSSGLKPPSQVSAGIAISGLNCTSGQNSISGSTLIRRPPRARDQVTMAEDGPAPGRVSDRFLGALGRNPTCRTHKRSLWEAWGLSPQNIGLPAL